MDISVKVAGKANNTATMDVDSKECNSVLEDYVYFKISDVNGTVNIEIKKEK